MSIFVTQQIVPANFIYFDTFEQWSVARPKTLTKHAVIPSPEITDHVQAQNITVSFRGHVSLAGGIVPSLGADRVRLFFDTIGGSLVTLATPFGVFASMVITQARDAEQVGSLVVDVVAEQIRIASITEIPIPPRTPNPAAAAQQASTQDVGSASASSSGASLATAVVDGVAGVADLLGF